MTKITKGLLVLSGLVLLGVASNGLAADKMASTKEVVWPADKIEYKEVIPGVSKAVLWENSFGGYEALTRFAPNTKNAMHTHSNDIQIVVISGHYDYGTEKGVTQLGPGSYVVIPGGRKHTSGSGSEGALFFEKSDGKFDLKFVK